MAELYGTSVGTGRDGPHVLSGIRLATPVDIPLILGIARERIDGFDASAAAAYLHARIQEHNVLALICSDEAFGLACAYAYGFIPGVYRCELIGLVSRRRSNPWSAYKILRSMLEWSRRVDCKDFRITGSGEINWESFIRRLGRDPAVEMEMPTYVIRLGHH